MKEMRSFLSNTESCCRGDGTGEMEGWRERWMEGSGEGGGEGVCVEGGASNFA